MRDIYDWAEVQKSMEAIDKGLEAIEARRKEILDGIEERHNLLQEATKSLEKTLEDQKNDNSAQELLDQIKATLNTI